MKNIVICGDSFDIGIGCHDLINEPYGSLLAKNFNKNLINFAKGSSTNLSIYLQVKYVIENIKDIDFVCVGVTSNNRVEWFPENISDKNVFLDNTNVNYHQYPPYGHMTYNYLIDNPMKDDSRYIGNMLTENYFGIIDYVDNHLDKNISGNNYFKKFAKEPSEKMKLLKDYYLNIFDDRIQQKYDMGVVIMSHLLLKKNNIRHYILTKDKELNVFIPEEFLIDVDWIELSGKYPDDLNTLHTSYKGHEIVYNKILNKMKIKNNLL